MAKSLGYGKIELELKHKNLDMLLKIFETEITSNIPNWSESEQLTELLTMATEQNNTQNSQLKYMSLTQFADSKSKDKDYLRNYTELDNIKSVSVQSLISKADLEALKVVQAKREEVEKRDLAEEKAWKIISESINLTSIQNFIKDFPQSRYIPIAKEKIEKIEKAKDDEESFKKEQEAGAKWDAVQKIDNKYKQKALKDFIENFFYSKLIENAKKELAKLESNDLRKPQGFDFTQATDIKSIERAMKPIQNPNKEDKAKLEEAIIRIYPNLNAKKRKQFVKSKLIVKWLGKDGFDEVLNRVSEEEKNFSKSDLDILQSLRDDGINVDGK